MNRRRMLQVSGLAMGGLVLGGTAWLAGPPASVRDMESWTAAHHWLDQLLTHPHRTTLGWPLPQVLEHLAQSIDYSLDGYPELKPAWFRHSVGPLAGRVFRRLGAMKHDLQAPIPGAPALAATDLANAAKLLRASMRRFEAHRGGLMPHFAYGALSRADYQRAHWMHLAEHGQLIVTA